MTFNSNFLTMEDLISVLIPAYNHEKYIQEAIKSVINQTYQNIELIVIDDGSQDRTWDKLNELKSECEDRFIKIFFNRQANCGTCITLNKLFSYAKGKYIALLASDDTFKPQMLSILHSFLCENDGYVLVVGDNEIINQDSQRVAWNKRQENVEFSKYASYKTFSEFWKYMRPDINFLSTQFGSYRSLLQGNYIPNGALIKRDAISQFGKFYPEAPLEDWYMNLQLAKIGKFRYINDVLFSYRCHNKNTFKNHDYMLKTTKQTWLFEICCVLKNETNWQRDAVLNFIKGSNKKDFLHIRSLLEIYRQKFYDEKYYFIKLFEKIYNIWPRQGLLEKILIKISESEK